MKLIYYIITITIFSSCKEKTITLISDKESSIKYIFKYTSDGIVESKLTEHQGKIYTNNTYYHKKPDGYYEDIDSVTNDSLRTFKKILTLNNTKYTYDSPFIASNDITNQVEIIKIGTNQYRYRNVRGSYKREIFFDGNYRIYKLVEKQNEDSIVFKSLD